MLVKDQISFRMQELKMSHRDLANLCGTSDKTIRHWTSGRSYPSKRMTPAIEKSLSFRIDFGEGGTFYGVRVLDSLNSREIDLLNKFQRLSPKARLHIEVLIDLLVAPTENPTSQIRKKRRTSNAEI